jgi:hypothetical protein
MIHDFKNGYLAASVDEGATDTRIAPSGTLLKWIDSDGTFCNQQLPAGVWTGVDWAYALNESQALAVGGWEYKNCPVHKNPKASVALLLAQQGLNMAHTVILKKV